MDIKSGVAYYKADKPVEERPAGFFFYDQQKLNLAWLVEPRLDTEGLECLVKSPIAASINENMDAVTREELRKMPLEFMRYWRRLDDGDLALTDGFPDGYTEVMEARAQEAHARLLGIVENGNVVHVNFRRTA